MSKALTNLREELIKISNIDFDEDIDVALDNKLIEFFKNIPYLRIAPEEEITMNFNNILYSNKEQGFKLLFFIRDKRNGLGERRIFRTLLKYLAKNERELLSNNLNIISKYGRWDDYYSLFDTSLEIDVINILKNQIQKDISSNFPSNLAKWLKSENASSKNTRYLAFKTRKLLGYSSKEYRLILTNLRKKLNIVENYIRTSNYNIINYKSLSPSVLYKYRKAFFKNDKQNYINSLNINKNSILENIDKIIKYKNNKNLSNSYNKYYFEKYKNFINSNNIDNLINIEIIDVIKNISNIEDTFVVNCLEKKGEDEFCKEIKVLLKTMLLYKKSNSNFFKNYYMYFDNNPKFKKITEGDFWVDIDNIYYKYINSNANVEMAVDTLLYTSIKQNIDKNSVPKSILFIYNTNLNAKEFHLDEVLNKWIKAGYSVPKIKLWNLSGFDKEFYIKNMNECIYIYGYDKELWSFLLENKEINRSMILFDKFQKFNYKVNMI